MYTKRCNKPSAVSVVVVVVMQDLCERHEKGVLHEHQRALQKYSVMKRQMMSATAQSKEQVSVEQLESRIVQVPLAFCPRRSLR